MDTSDRTAPDGTMLTVAHLIDSYDAHLLVLRRLGQIAPATLEWYRDGLAKLRTAAEKFPAAELRAHHLVSVDLTNHFVRVLKALYRWAADPDVELVPRDPFRKLTTPPCGQRTRVLTRPELRRLMRAATPQLRPLLMLAGLTGARPGELRRLTWGQVFETDRVIRLTKFKAKDRRRDGLAVRSIPLSRVALRILRYLRSRATDTTHDAIVLVSARGRAWTANGVQCAIRRARRKAGLEDGGERIVLYTARHTFATTATRNGIGGRILADILGQTNTAMTQRYQHLCASDLVAAIDRATGAKDPSLAPVPGSRSTRDRAP